MYEIDLHQIFRIGSRMIMADYPDIRFAVAQGTLPWQLILEAKSAK